MRIFVKFYAKKVLMNMNENEMNQTVFSLALEALRR